MTNVSKKQCKGLLFIGDPHLEARVPGFRKDDYPTVALAKFRWCLQYARENELQPFLLGDLFQLPQDNPNWLLSEIIASIEEPLPSIYGNHDVRENSLKPNDSIHILFASGCLVRLSEDEPWVGEIAGLKTVVAGTDWNGRLPKGSPERFADSDLLVWLTHHDIFVPGYEEAGRVRPKELPGIDLVINGHIHRRLPIVEKGSTRWVTAGNITRRARSDASRDHVPAVVQVFPRPASTTAVEPDWVASYAFESRRGRMWDVVWARVPHESFDAVFHPELEVEEAPEKTGSGFIADLRELTARRTDSGAGLQVFLDQHLDEFEPRVAEEIRRLAAEVTEAAG